MNAETVPRLSYSVTEAAAALGISKPMAYQLVAEGKIPSVKLGGRILVPRAALERLVTSESQEEQHVDRQAQGSSRLAVYRPRGSRS